MRVTTAFWRLLRLQGVWVRAVAFDADRVVVRVALRRSRLVCPLCAFTTSASEGVQAHDSVWRHLDLGVWRLEIRARLRQLRCPVHGVHVEAVPFARHRAGLTRDLDDLVAWLATKADKTTISRLVGVDWQTVGRVVARVCDEQLDERRLDDLFDIGIDEIAWRGGHRYLTLVTDHPRGKIVWGAEGRSAAVADAFFADLDPPAPGEPAILPSGRTGRNSSSTRRRWGSATPPDRPKTGWYAGGSASRGVRRAPSLPALWFLRRRTDPRRRRPRWSTGRMVAQSQLRLDACL